MARVKRLVTFADVGPQANDDTMSVLARLELELTDGTRVLLLKNRGWVGSGPPGVWAWTSVQEIVDTARVVVGPDEPSGDESQEDMAVLHWTALQAIAQRQGVATHAAELRQLPHDVVLSPRLLARIGADPAGNGPT
jgi:hypothetical protein